MSTWKRLASKPAGALPANIVGKVGVLLITVLLLALVFSVSLTSDDPEPGGDSAPGAEQPIVNPAAGDALPRRIREQEMQARLQEQAAQREAERQLRLQAAGMGASGEEEPAGPPPVDPETGEALTAEEHDLRQAIRLEDVERQLRSLRTSPVAQTYRTAEGAAPDDAGNISGLRMPAPPAPTDAMDGVPPGPEALPAPDPSGYTPMPGSLDVPLPNAANLPDYDNPPRFAIPRDPPGWERIFEGSFVEAVLVTQLSGDFPSPVLATAAVPFYSADRQRVLIPRGSRFIGTAQPVRGQDQERLAVGFHRVILPDGTHVALQFQGLNQMGEGALKDQVDRHYLSTFLAAGAVGLMSGFAAIGGNPYAGGLAGYRSGVAQSTSETGVQVMRRFLNRLPTVTIRAGHRLRIWFTSDALFPSRRRSLP
ncbi:MAG: hypothetical protein OXP70_02250 [Acidobacteriota bacterium]|nr:hypothetical protein [Acidobacteriota bacterium]